MKRSNSKRGNKINKTLAYFKRVDKEELSTLTSKEKKTSGNPHL